MTQIVTYRYRLKDRHSARHLRELATAVNQVWNYANGAQKHAERLYRAGGSSRRWPSHFDLTKLTAGTSKELGILATTIGEVCRVYAECRTRARHSLRWRVSQGARRSLGWIPFRDGDARRIDGNSIILAGKRYRFFGNKRRPIPDGALNGSLVEDARGRWWLCIKVPAPERKCGSRQIGIDLGLKSLVTTSDGLKAEAPQIYRSWERKLRTAQRARRTARVRAIHAKIANSRHDFLHKLSTALVQNSNLIAVGDVSASDLARTSMGKSVLDAGWYAFKMMLRYKCQQAGASFLEVDESFSSVTCSSCQARSGPKGRKGLRVREWQCAECGAVHDRDCNAAKIILARSVTRPVEGSFGLAPGDRHEIACVGGEP